MITIWHCDGSRGSAGNWRQTWRRFARLIRSTAAGLTLLTLSALGSGCGHSPPIPPRPVPLPIAPSERYLIPTEIPPYWGEANGELEAYAHDLVIAIRSCNQDKASLAQEVAAAVSAVSRAAPASPSP